MEVRRLQETARALAYPSRVQAIHRGRRVWPLATAALSVVLLMVAALGTRGDLAISAALGTLGLALVAVSVWGWVAVDRIDVDAAHETLRVRIYPDTPRPVPLGAIRALSIVPARTFVFGRHSGRLMRVDRIDSLMADTAEGPQPIARGDFDEMREVARRLASLPTSRFAAPTTPSEPRGAMDRTLRSRLQGALAIGVHESVAIETRAALEATSPTTAEHAASSTEGSDPDELRRMLEADAAARQPRRRRRKR